MPDPINQTPFLRVGALASATGKTVRAMHLYEQLGLLQPKARTDGGFRLYDESAISRIQWIIKLQAVGLTLGQIKELTHDFNGADSAKDAAQRTQSVFQESLATIRKQISDLQIIEKDLMEAIDYLHSCGNCEASFIPPDCHSCDHNGHEQGNAPALFAELTGTANTNTKTAARNSSELLAYDVDESSLKK